MNTLLFSHIDRINSDQIGVRDHRLTHMISVLKIQIGQQIRVGQIGGEMGLATVLELSTKEAILQVKLSDAAPAKLPLTIVLALPRPKMLRRILRTVAELGVEELHLINSYRVEKSYWQSPVLEGNKVEEYFIQGLEQACDTIFPRLHLHSRFKPFVEDVLPELNSGKLALAAHPGKYPVCPRDVKQPTVLVIGPEGGFIPYEVAKLQQAACDIVTLGNRILRVENAVTSLIGRLF